MNEIKNPYLTEEQLAAAKNKHRSKVWKTGNRMGNMVFPDRLDKKSKCLTATKIVSSRETIHIQDSVGIRTLLPEEYEKLQTVPVSYTCQATENQRYKMLGNGWTIDIIAHIFKNMEIKQLNVLSLFDGMSCGQIALERAGFKVGKYFASEVDKHPIKVTQHNYPNTIQIGDVTKVRYENGILHTENGAFETEIDLLIGGSPCQGFSFAGKQLNFDDPRSRLFFEYVRLLDETGAKHFLLENVKMKKEFQDVITIMLGVDPIEINSALVSAQNRKRLYWTNIPGVGQPEDKGIFLKDIVLDDALPVTFTERRTEEAKQIRKEYSKLHGRDFSPRRSKELVARKDEKSNCLTAAFSTKEHMVLSKKVFEHIPSFVIRDKSQTILATIHKENAKSMAKRKKYGLLVYQFPHGGSVGGVRELEKAPTLSQQWHNNYFKLIHSGKASATVVADFFKGVPYNVLKDWDCIRKFHPTECERLQTVPDGYTAHVSDTQRYRMLGNGWTIDVIAHIFKNLWKSI